MKLPKESPIRDMRLKRKMTQSQVAAKIGTSQATYRMYENAEKQPSIRTAHRISEALDSTLRVIFPDWWIQQYPDGRPEANSKRKAKKKAKRKVRGK